MNPENLERETGVEPATSTLARSRSTTELLPLVITFYSIGYALPISQFVQQAMPGSYSISGELQCGAHCGS